MRRVLQPQFLVLLPTLIIWGLVFSLPTNAQTACTCLCGLGDTRGPITGIIYGPNASNQCEQACNARSCGTSPCSMDRARSTCDDVLTTPGSTPPTSQYSLEGADPLNLQTGSGRNVVTLASTVITYVLGFVGAAVFIAFLYGGTLIIFSAGNPKRVGAGKNVLVYSVIGLAIIFFSYAVLNLFFNVLKSGVI